MCCANNIEDILCCPACRGELKKEKMAFSCEKCRLKYPLKEGIYCFLKDEAEKF